MADTGKTYVQLINCTEDEVNEMISQGYLPQFVTTKRSEIIKSGNLVNVKDDLVYHFLRRKKKEETK